MRRSYRSALISRSVGSKCELMDRVICPDSSRATSSNEVICSPTLSEFSNKIKETVTSCPRAIIFFQEAFESIKQHELHGRSHGLATTCRPGAQRPQKVSLLLRSLRRRALRNPKSSRGSKGSNAHLNSQKFNDWPRVLLGD